jgi:GntR family transcriptional regulator
MSGDSSKTLGHDLSSAETAVSVESSSPIPLYYQLANVLQARIHSGDCPPGSLLGTEKDLAATFGVSRITVEKALNALHQEGLVDRQRARGTFVSKNLQARTPAQRHGFLEDILLLVERGRTVELETAEVPAPAEIAERFGIEAGASITRVRRLRVPIQNGPTTWVINYLPLDVGRRFDLDQLRTQSIVRLIDQSPGLRLAYGHETVKAEPADEEVAARLGVAPGAPVLFIERDLQTATGRTVDVAHLHSLNNRYSVRLSRLQR